MKISSLVILIFALLCQSCFAQNITVDRKKENTIKTVPSSRNQTELNAKEDTVNNSLLKSIDTLAQIQTIKEKDSAEFEGLVLEMDDRINILAKAYMSNKTLKGYKVQIFSGQSRWEASKVKSEFISAYPKLPTPNLTYHAPNFKLRIGNYRNRFEAEKNLRILKEKFPSAFLVKDEISIEFKD
jgi:hypothetical protein